MRMRIMNLMVMNDQKFRMQSSTWFGKGARPGFSPVGENAPAQVQGFTGAQYKSFPAAVRLNKPSGESMLLILENLPQAGNGCSPCIHRLPIAIAWTQPVPAAPGRWNTAALTCAPGRRSSRQGPYQHGTNNIGEFLAIVHALKLLEKTEEPAASLLGFIHRRSAGSKRSAAILNWQPSEQNAALFKLIDKAEDWLAEHAVANPILKWDTKAWGEIPADFNRK
jgi:ribonuclease HI